MSLYGFGTKEEILAQIEAIKRAKEWARSREEVDVHDENVELPIEEMQ